MEKEFDVLYVVQAPIRLGNDKIQKVIQLLKNGDLDSLLKCKKLIIELINERK